MPIYRQMLNRRQDGNEENPSGLSRCGNGGATRSLGTSFSSQSASTSASTGSQSAAATPPRDIPSLRFHRLDIDDDGARSQGPVGNKKKGRGQRAVDGDKSGRGLRQFSMKVCEKVESKGRTTYNEVADELVTEFSDPGNTFTSPDKKHYDEKNIRRRVYDALNVLMAMDIIARDKKEIHWKGLPGSIPDDIKELKRERLRLRNTAEKKAAYLQELEEQCSHLQNLMERNKQLYIYDTPSGAVGLPFILVQTRPHATVEVEISEDMQLVHFDFNSTPFELHDDSYVLKEMKIQTSYSEIFQDYKILTPAEDEKKNVIL